MKKITTKWLIKKDACPDGVKWFERNYPDGLVITKRNMSVLIDKLLRRKKGFLSNYIKWDTYLQLIWLSRNIIGDLRSSAFYIKPTTITNKTLLDAFWEEYETK